MKAFSVNLDDQEPLPFNDAMFGVITCCAVPEHIYSTDFVVSEMFRLMKSDGYAIVMTPRLDSLLNIRFLPSAINCPMWSALQSESTGRLPPAV